MAASPVADDTDVALRTKYAQACQKSIALQNELSVVQRDFRGCQELVSALEEKLRQVTKQRDSFESLARRLQDWQRASQSELAEETKRREGVHRSATDLLEKFDASLKHSRLLEEERKALLEREAALLGRVSTLEQVVESNGKIKELQDKLIEAVNAESGATKADRDGALERLARALAEKEASEERCKTYMGEVDRFDGKLKELSALFESNLAQQKKVYEKVRQKNSCFLPIIWPAPFLTPATTPASL